MGCMTTQIIHEAETAWDGRPKERPDKMIQAPKQNKMRGRGDDDEDEVQEGKEFSDIIMPWDKPVKQQNASQ